MVLESDICSLCPRTRREHEQDEINEAVHHRFSATGESLQGVGKAKTEKKSKEPRLVMSPGSPSDPILRTILIEKGIITIEDLEKAERILGATGVLRTHGDPTVGH